jgi:hypothetical protein
MKELYYPYLLGISTIVFILIANRKKMPDSAMNN